MIHFKSEQKNYIWETDNECLLRLSKCLEWDSNAQDQKHIKYYIQIKGLTRALGTDHVAMWTYELEENHMRVANSYMDPLSDYINQRNFGSEKMHSREATLPLAEGLVLGVKKEGEEPPRSFIKATRDRKSIVAEFDNIGGASEILEKIYNFSH